MHRRRIVLVVATLMGAFALVTGGPTASAVTTPDQSEAHSGGSRTVTVREGDYLDKLADENETTYLRLFYANETIDDPDLIYPGQQLRIPDPSEPLTPRPLPANTVIPAPHQPRAHQPSPQPASQALASAAGTSVWDQLAACESGGNWATNTGNGYYGGLQFSASSWQAAGGTGYANQASRDEQIYRAQLLQARQGWSAWPACSAKLGLR